MSWRDSAATILFAAEGVRVIEFAQSGLKPLLKYARRMGIAWHVLTDGDEAGKKYAATARSQLQPYEQEGDHLTQFPAPDIEHFLYKHSLSDVYHQMAHLPLNMQMNARRIITKAIHHSSKPELAMAAAAGDSAVARPAVWPRNVAGARSGGLKVTRDAKEKCQRLRLAFFREWSE